LREAGALCEFSPTAIESFIFSNYVCPANIEEIPKNSDALNKTIRLYRGKEKDWAEKRRESLNKKHKSEWEKN
jgi:hypothetical protein